MEKEKTPENYEAGGRKALNNATKNNFLEILFILTMIVWLGTSLIISVRDIFEGFQHLWLTTSFIVGTTIGVYLKTKDYIKTKKKFFSFNRKKGCNKCGKNKSKKV
tara:strand:- start:101 stop:418 length:318 start_codon:yes stop_codon:yes gene_type:complete